MLREMKKLLVSLFIMSIATGFCYSAGNPENELVSWESHFEMVQSLEAGGWGSHVLLTETSKVKVGTFKYSEEKVVDVFYPPQMDFDELKPLLIMVGLSDSVVKKDYGVPNRYTEQTLGWAQSAAEMGFVVLAHETGGSPKDDLVSLVNWVRSKGKKYGLDGDKIGLWTCSDACEIAIKGLRPDNNGFPKPSAAFAVFYYGNLIAYSGLDPDVPMLVVTGEKDGWTDLSGIEKFIDKMNALGGDVTHLHHSTGSHGFEIAEDSPETRSILDQTFSFMLSSIK